MRLYNYLMLYGTQGTRWFSGQAMMCASPDESTCWTPCSDAWSRRDLMTMSRTRVGRWRTASARRNVAGVLKTDGFATAHQANLIASDIRQPAALLPAKETGRRMAMIQHISAVTFAVRDMARSVEFYRKLGLSCSTAVTMRRSAVCKLAKPS